MLKRVYYKLVRLFGSSESYKNFLKYKGIKIGENVRFRSPKLTTIDISRPSLVEFGSNIDVNDNFTLLTHDFGTYVFRELFHDFVPSSGAVRIGNNIVFGRNVTILKGVTIGDNCIIGLGSVITKSIPSGSVVAGCPARVICTIEDYYLRRKQDCVNEAFEYGLSIIERYGRKPIISDFTEEWSLFLTKQEYEDFLGVRKHVDFRMKRHLFVFWEKERPFNGFGQFYDAMMNYKNNNNGK